MPEISRRAQSLGTENAFVVLAEVNALARQGKDIVSFCIGQPDFPAPDNVQEAAIRAIKGGKHGYTPSAGIDELRAAAADIDLVLHAMGGDPERPAVGEAAIRFLAGRLRDADEQLEAALDQHLPQLGRQAAGEEAMSVPLLDLKAQHDTIRGERVAVRGNLLLGYLDRPDWLFLDNGGSVAGEPEPGDGQE